MTVGEIKRVYYRDMPSKEIRFLDQSGEIQSLPAKTVLKKLGVGSVIRIRQSEYPVAAQPGQKLWHINLPIFDGGLGEWVLLAEIMENGHRHSDQEKFPLLSFAQAFLARTTAYLNNVSQAEFQADWLRTAIGLTSQSEIPQLLYDRYHLVRGISLDETTTTPIAIRQFKIRKFLGLKALDALK